MRLIYCCYDSIANFINFFVLTDDEVIVSFELATYGASEGQGSVEVCAVPSATPLPGQSVSVLVSTEDGTAIGKKFLLCSALLPSTIYCM